MSLSDRIVKLIAENKVMVFSKSYCPYCKNVKTLFTGLGVKHCVVELDQEDGGSEMQNILLEMTGQRTVPNVFINGKHVGGCDETVALEKSGELTKMLQ